MPNPKIPNEEPNDPTEEKDGFRLRFSKSTFQRFRALGEELKARKADDVLDYLLVAHDERYSPHVFSDLVEFEALLDCLDVSAHTLASSNYLLSKLMIDFQDGKYARLKVMGDLVLEASDALRAAEKNLREGHNHE